MIRSLSGVLAIALAVAALAVSLLRKSPRIGIVDNAMLMSQFTEALAAEKRLKELEASWNANLKTLQDSVQAAVDSLSKKYGEAKESDRRQMGESLNRWNAELSRYQAAMDKLRTEKQRELLNPVLEKINAFVKQWARENGYAVVLGTGNGGVVLAVAEAQNVTPQILKDLNRLYAGADTAASKSPGKNDVGGAGAPDPQPNPDTAGKVP